VHAVSVGEVRAIAPLIRHLLADHKDLPITLTTTTPTGSDQVQRLLGEAVFHVYMPYDVPWALGRFLDAVRPSALLMVETEIWPNLLRECRQRGIDSLLANARLSARSLRRYQRLGHFARQTFALIDQVAAQSADDADRFRALGVAGEAIRVTGSIKFDVDIAASVEEQAEVMQRSWAGRPVWVAASTHEGEEEIVLDAHRRLLEKHPNALLVLVPRHPERFERVAQAVVRAKLSIQRRSSGEPPGRAQVYLGDTMGELTAMLGAADVAFIGGSLRRHGGHNMLEASAQGVPTTFGPYTFNFVLISRLLLECGAAQRVQDAASLAGVLDDWLSDASVRSAAGEAGHQMVEQNRGAMARLYVLVQQMMEE